MNPGRKLPHCTLDWTPGRGTALPLPIGPPPPLHHPRESKVMANNIDGDTSAAPLRTRTPTMCLMKVKEEEADYTVPARVKRVSRVRRYEESPPRRVERSSYIREERRSVAPPASLPPPPAPPSIKPPTVYAPTARAPSVRSTTQSHYVEVEEDSTPSSASSSSSEDVRSRATSHHTRKTKSVAPPRSEYSVHEREKEIRRYSKPREPEFETYRYVNAPPEAQGRGSRDVVRRERERIVIEDGYGSGRKRRSYRD
ncbi:hypothetical protein LTR53_009216 [Teratosphaeriaceae sp. CCFEE 6253]|nr:hypothetical protein LTR53_009216 [Teratosphaeriaceae sp. CCFEE 6253]